MLAAVLGQPVVNYTRISVNRLSRTCGRGPAPTGFCPRDARGRQLYFVESVSSQAREHWHASSAPRLYFESIEGLHGLDSGLHGFP